MAGGSGGNSSDITVNGTSSSSNTVNDSSVNTNLNVIAGDANSHTISVGNGADTITVGNGNSNNVYMGNGNDMVTVGSGDNILNAGNGIDTFTLVGDSVILGTDAIYGAIGDYTVIGSGNIHATLHFGQTDLDLSSNGNGTYTLTAFNSIIGSHTYANSTGTFIVHNNNNVLTFSTTGANGSLNLATLTSTVTLVGSNDPTLTISLSPSFSGEGAIFDAATLATVAGGSGSYSYSINAVNTNSNFSSSNFSKSTFNFAPTALGDYTVTATVTDTHGHQASAVFDLFVHTVDLSSFSHAYTVDLDFVNANITVTDTTANATPIVYDMNGINNHFIIEGSHAADVFNVNDLGSSTIIGAAGFNNVLSYENDIHALTFTYNGSTQTGTVADTNNSSLFDSVSNIQTFYGNSNTDLFNLSNINHDTFYTFGGNDTFTLTNDGGNNQFNLNSGGSDTFTGLSNDTVALDSGHYTITLPDEGSGTTFTGGDGSSSLLLTGVFGNTYTLSGSGNTIDYSSNNSNLNFVYDGSAHSGSVNDASYLAGGPFDTLGNFSTFSGSAGHDTFDLSNISGDTFNTYGQSEFTLRLSGGITTDGGSNTFNLLGSGEVDTFTNISGDSIRMDNTSSHIVTLNDQGGINNFFLTDSGIVNTVTDTFNNLSNDVFNIYTSGFSLVANNDTGGNTIRLSGGSGDHYSLSGFGNDAINFNGSANIELLNRTGTLTLNLQAISSDTILLDNGSDSIVLNQGTIVTLQSINGPSSELTGQTFDLNNSVVSFPFAIRLDQNGGSNTFNLNTVGGDTIQINSSGNDTFNNLGTLDGDLFDFNQQAITATFTGAGGSILLANAHNNVINLGDSAYTIRVLSEGPNTYNLNQGGASVVSGVTDTFDGISNDTINLYSSGYTIAVLNDGGGNTFALQNTADSTDSATFSGIANDTIDLLGGRQTIHVESGSGTLTFDLKNTSDNYTTLYFDGNSTNTTILNHANDINNGDYVEVHADNMTFDSNNSQGTFNLNVFGDNDIFNINDAGNTTNLFTFSSPSIHTTINYLNTVISSGYYNFIDLAAQSNDVVTFEGAGRYLLLGDIGGDTFNLGSQSYNILTSSDTNSNIFNLNQGGASVLSNVTDTFNSISNDTINLYSSGYTLALPGDNGSNIINLHSNGGSDTFTGLYNDTIHLTDGVYALTFLNSSGTISLDLKTISANTLLLDNNPATYVLGLGNSGYVVNLESVNGISSELTGQTFDLNSNGGYLYGIHLYQNGGSNTFNLNTVGGDYFNILSSGSDTFNNLGVLNDVFNMGASGITTNFTGVGGSIELDNAHSDTINLGSSAYTLQLVNELGPNTFNLNQGGASVLSGITDTFDGISSDTINLYSHGYTIAVLNDGGSNTFNLQNTANSSNSVTFQGIANDIIDLLGGNQTIHVESGSGILTFNLFDTVNSITTLYFDSYSTNTTVLNHTNDVNNASYVNIHANNTTFDSNNSQGDFYLNLFGTNDIFNINDVDSSTINYLQLSTSGVHATFNYLNTISNDTIDLFSHPNAVITFEGAGGTIALVDVGNDTFNLGNQSYTISTSADTNSNTFNLNQGGASVLSNVTDTFNSLAHDTFNLYSSGYTIALNSDGGSNIFNLHSDGGNDTFTGLHNDTINFNAFEPSYNLTLLNSTGINTINIGHNPFGFNLLLDNSADTLVLNNGNFITIQSVDGSSAELTGRTFDLNNSTVNKFTVQLYQSGGSNTFNLNTNGGDIFQIQSDATDVFNNLGSIDGDQFYLDGIITASFTGIGGSIQLLDASGSTINLGDHSYTLQLSNEHVNGNLSNTFNLNNLQNGSSSGSLSTSATDTFDGISHDTINVYSSGYTLATVNDGGGNTFNLLSNGGSDTLTGLTNDNVVLDPYAYTLTLSSSGSGNTITGGNGASTLLLSGVFGNTYNLAAGNNVISYQNDSTDSLTFIYNGSTQSGTVGDGTHTDTIDHFQTFYGNAGTDDFTLTDVSNDVFNTYGDNTFTFTLSGGVTTDGGGNTFNLFNGGTYAFNNLSTITPDTINFNSSYTVVLSGGGSVIFQDSGGLTSLANENITLRNGSYTIQNVNDVGGSQYALTGGGTDTFTALNHDTITLDDNNYTLVMNSDGGYNTININENDLSPTSTSVYTLNGLTNDIVNLFTSGETITMDQNLNGGSNTFNLTSGGGNDVFSGLVGGDTIALNDNFGYTLDISDVLGTIGIDLQGVSSLVTDTLHLGGSFSVNLHNGGILVLDGINNTPLTSMEFYLYDINADANPYSITVANDGGGNAFHLESGGTSTFYGVNNDSFDLLGGAPYYSISLVGNGSETFNNIANDTINLSGNYTITLQNNGGGNTFYLNNGGSDTFYGLSAGAMDTFNLNGANPYAIALHDGGNVVFENLNGSPLGNDTFQLYGNYTIGVNDDGGNNTFNLIDGGTYTFATLNNEFNTPGIHLYSDHGDTINLDNHDYSIALSQDVINNIFNGGTGDDTFQFHSALGNNVIDGGLGQNTLDFSQFSIPNGDTLKLDLPNNLAYLTNNGTQAGLSESVMNFDNVKIGDLSTNILGVSSSNTVVDLSALSNTVDLNSWDFTPNWSNISGLTLGATQSLSIDAQNVQNISNSHTLAITAANGSNDSLTLTQGWTETAGQNVGSGPVTGANGHTYDVYTATVASVTQTLLVDENIHDKHVS